MASEVSNSLIETVKADAQARRRQAADKLRELLLRESKPRRGDADDLAAIMVVLGLRAEDLPDLVVVVQRLARYEGLIEGWGDVCVAELGARKRLLAVDAWATGEHARVDAEAKAKREPLQAELGQIQGHKTEIAEARRWLMTLQARWLALGEGISEEQALDRLRVSGGMPDGAAAGASNVTEGQAESAEALVD